MNHDAETEEEIDKFFGNLKAAYKTNIASDVKVVGIEIECPSDILHSSVIFKIQPKAVVRKINLKATIVRDGASFDEIMEEFEERSVDVSTATEQSD